MSTYHDHDREKPPHEDVKNRSTNEARTFKKTTQTVHGRPGVTDHDFHEDLLKSPPNNIPDDAVPEFTDEGMKAPKKSEKEAEDGVGGAVDPPLGLYDEEGTGRAKPLDVQTDLIDTSESTSRA